MMLNITHAWDADLQIHVEIPGFEDAIFVDRRGSYGANFTRTILDYNCSTNIASGSAPFTGCYRPDINISTVPGHNLSGPWVLHPQDIASGISGTLQNWAVLLCTAP
jgi:hypothetical protein